MYSTLESKDQNTVFYQVYSTSSSSNLEELRLQCLQTLGNDLDVIWNAESFALEIKDTPTLPHLSGRLWFDNSVEDEWYVVWLLQKLSKNLPVVIKVWDDDGSFLLIEAAEVIPSWLTPENSENRLLLYQGGCVLIPLPTSPADIVWLPQNMVTMESAIVCAQKVPQNDAINKNIDLKLREFPNRSLHRIRCHLPIPLIHALTTSPSLISPIISAYLHADNREVQSIIKNRQLDWRDTLDTNIQVTRCQYAQIYSQRIGTCNAWPYLPVGHVDHQARDIGVKIACGAEIVLAIAEGNSLVDKEFSKYIKRLRSFRYFGDYLEGSKAYTELMKKAEVYFQASRNGGSEMSYMIDSHKLKSVVMEAMNNLEVCDLYKHIEKVPDSDSDVWMDDIPADVQQWFVNSRKTNKMQSDTCPSEMTQSPEIAKSNEASNKNLNNVNTKLHGFIDNISSHEGAEIPEINLNVDDFMDCLRDFKDQVDKAAATSELSESDDTSSLDSESEEEMKEYMHELEEQLKGTTMSDSFAKDDSGDLDIDLNLVSNVLHSFSAETGLTGPASSILASLGVHLPRDEDVAGTS